MFHRAICITQNIWHQRKINKWSNTNNKSWTFTANPSPFVMIVCTSLWINSAEKMRSAELNALNLHANVIQIFNWKNYFRYFASFSCVCISICHMNDNMKTVFAKAISVRQHLCFDIYEIKWFLIVYINVCVYFFSSLLSFLTVHITNIFLFHSNLQFFFSLVSVVLVQANDLV